VCVCVCVCVCVPASMFLCDEYLRLAAVHFQRISIWLSFVSNTNFWIPL